MTRQTRVLFVCLGNICRSPTAQGVFEQLVRDAGLDALIAVDSAGTGDWHLGKAPDQRARQAALGRGVDIGHLRARLVTPADFDHFDYILAMDRANLDALERMKPDWYLGHVGLFLPFAGELGEQDPDEVPDPYYGGFDGFERVYELVYQASLGLLDHIRVHHVDAGER
ncbi:MAG: low molecular weight protein-tyrosine-phosphatase [Porticoccaceae bacterium]|jgi:protein-tyrosine phosphatase|nr:low molecular weight protein-tyrosine-phosphatase [Porticoccaceae bacterium]MEA3301321.1 low molecular weight protein-tyrosine-phosphatase [Pseudomonadota bacterium]HLS99404.1 low molecular weight protein-tyrosine-phosphatase [Porticoccaceae bacterium]